jgi:hydroxymethylpyrimidine kinase/phosphomethylpyrimidine kinase
MVATSGAQLLPGDAVSRLRSELLHMTTVLTPNIPEATLLLRDADIQYRTPSSLKDLKALAKTLHSLGPKHILLKGGHMPLTKAYKKATTDDEKAITVDILYPSAPNDTESSDAFTIVESKYLTIPNTHGTGCSLASALAANIAFSPPPTLSTAVRSAVNYVSHGILTSPQLQSSLHNHGPGPINHFHSLLSSPFPLGHFVDYLLSHPSITPVWKRFIHHSFTYALGSGTLPIQRFKNYLIQDYLYLTHFARTYALAGYKSNNISNIARSAEMILHIQTEMEMHLEYCAEFGIRKEEIEQTRESVVGTAYSRYVFDVGMRGDVLGLYVALAPCLIGYGVVAERLARNVDGMVGGEGSSGQVDVDGTAGHVDKKTNTQTGTTTKT